MRFLTVVSHDAGDSVLGHVPVQKNTSTMMRYPGSAGPNTEAVLLEVISKIATDDEVDSTKMNEALTGAEFVVESDQNTTVVL